MGDAVPLPPAHSGLQRVQQGGSQSGGKQIYLVGIEHRPVGTASKPGWKVLRPVRTAASSSTPPSSMSSVALTGSSTKRTPSSPPITLAVPSSPHSSTPPMRGSTARQRRLCFCPLLSHHGGEGTSVPINGTLPPS